MELIAAIGGLGALKRRCAVKLYTDSKYVLQGLTEWLPNWKRAAGARRRASRSRIKTCGSCWMRAAAAQDIQRNLGEGVFGT